MDELGSVSETEAGSVSSTDGFATPSLVDEAEVGSLLNFQDIPSGIDISPAAKSYLEHLLKEATHTMLVKLKSNEEKLVKLANDLKRSQAEVRAVKIEMDNLQQYTRRRSVRIEGIEVVERETEEQLFGTIQEKLAELDVHVGESDVIRFHRSAAPKPNKKTGKLCAQVIVKFARWQHRRQCHFANKKARAVKSTIRVHHDLTKRRYGLLLKARKLIDDKYGEQPDQDENDVNAPPKVFAYADMNSNLLVRRGREAFPFNDEKELPAIVDNLPQ
jgi:2'-5' RNA ligase